MFYLTSLVCLGEIPRIVSKLSKIIASIDLLSRIMDSSRFKLELSIILLNRSISSIIPYIIFSAQEKPASHKLAKFQKNKKSSDNIIDLILEYMLHFFGLSLAK